jgi:subtilisin family serine protease
VDNIIKDESGKDIFCPGLDNIISVASSNSSDTLAASSNYGKNTVDVAAPGEFIYSTVPLSGTTASVTTVGATPAVEYPALGMEYAPLTEAEGITGVLYDCGMGYSGYTCQAELLYQIPAAVSGNIALIQRGNCDGHGFYFWQKVQNAMARGAAGVIIYNNLADDPDDDDNFDTEGGTLGSPGSWIPVVSISKTAGEGLLSLLSEYPLHVALINKPTVNPYKYISGTSMAAPHVAGLAGMIFGRCPSIGYADVKAAIINSSDKIPAIADKTVSGGRINAFAALTSLFPPGDLSADCRIGLDDAILAMRILVGLEATLLCPLSTAACRLDTNGNGAIGPEEVIYILQEISRLRQ